MADSFETLPLHDARVLTIEIGWERQRCCFRLSAFAAASADATLHLLTFEEVTSFSMPHRQPWGASSSIHAAGASGRNFTIEMHSRDVLEIEAAGLRWERA